MAQLRTIHKARQLYEILKGQILAGAFSPENKLPSIRRLAQQYGMSKTTVNTVFAMLSTEGLITISEGLGAYTSSGRQPRQLAFLVSDFFGELNEYTELFAQIQRRLGTGYYLSVFECGNSIDLFLSRFEEVCRLGVAGVIAVPPKCNDAPDPFRLSLIAERLRGRIPVVFIIRRMEGMAADFFSVDFGKGVYRAAAYFAAQGKKKMGALLHGVEKFRLEEAQALRRAAADFSIDCLEATVCPDRDPDVGKKLKSLIERGADALVAPSGVIYRNRELILSFNRRIPSELSLVGLGDVIYPKMFVPPLTAISFQAERIAASCLETLIARIESRLDSPPITKNFTPQLIPAST